VEHGQPARVEASALKELVALVAVGGVVKLMRCVVPTIDSAVSCPWPAAMKALLCPHRPPPKQHGSTLIEFSLAAVLLLTVGLGIIEAAHWFAVRQTVGLALMQAARTGAVTHARPEKIEQAFERGLLPLFAGRSELQARLAQTRTALGAAPWRIQVDSPHLLAFSDFDPLPASLAPTALPALDNDYLFEQHARYVARGWPQGRGQRSRQTIFDANTLTLTLYWPHRPLLASKRSTAWRQGFVVMHRHISVLMQSHPVLWPDLPSGKVIRNAYTSDPAQ